MKLAFILFTWFPHGGLQQDLIKIIRACQAQGPVETSVFCMQWDGAKPDGVTVNVVRAQGWSRVARRRAFADYIVRHVQGGFDLLVGFNRLPGLDYYFAADICFAWRARFERGWWYRLAPRTRQYLAWEQAVFGPRAHTVSLLLSPQQREQYTSCYHTPANRLIELPPGIDRRHIAPADAARVRQEFRALMQIADTDLVVLQIGSSFRVKGLDRSLLAFAALPAALRSRVRLFVVGRDDFEPWRRKAQALGLDKVRFFAARDDIPRFLQGADLLLHPSQRESAGMVILEAIVAGLPVLCTGACGYAMHVERAGAGQVCGEPFNQAELNRKLQEMLEADRHTWRENGINYGLAQDLYDMPQRVAQILLGRTHPAPADTR